jgi:hypothetical protein
MEKREKKDNSNYSLSFFSRNAELRFFALRRRRGEIMV